MQNCRIHGWQLPNVSFLSPHISLWSLNSFILCCNTPTLFNLLGKAEAPCASVLAEARHQTPNTVILILCVQNPYLHLLAVTCTADFWTCYFHSHSGSSWKAKHSVSGGFINRKHIRFCVHKDSQQFIRGHKNILAVLKQQHQSEVALPSHKVFSTDLLAKTITDSSASLGGRSGTELTLSTVTATLKNTTMNAGGIGAWTTSFPKTGSVTVIKLSSLTQTP